MEGILQEAKSYYFGSFLKSYFYLTGILSWIPPALPSLFTLITNHNQFGLIEFYENFHPEWPLRESKFIGKQSSRDPKQSLIWRGSPRGIAAGNEIVFAAESTLVAPPGFSEVAEERA